MNKEEFEKYLESIGGLTRGWKPDKGPITEAGFFSYNEGWYELTKNLINELLVLGWNKTLIQAKEKFGGLRFYADDIPEGGHKIILKYEDLSYTICENCGKEGVLRSGSWLRTLCDEHSEGKEPFKKMEIKKAPY